MLFGNREEFAIEAVLEMDPQYGCVQSANLAGRFCLWIGGAAVGRIEEPSCWFGAFREHLGEHARSIQDHWEASFESLTPEQIFDHLDRLLYAAHRGECLDPDELECEAGELWRFNFLTNVSEVFDGWKAFLIFHAKADEVLALVRHEGAPLSYTFSREALQTAVAAFNSWLVVEERRLLPHLFV